MNEIKGYEGLYSIDDQGNIYSLKNTSSRRKRKIKPFINNSGYLRVGLYDLNGKRKGHYIHRLVAETFISNPNKLPIVNHKDGNKQNNHVSNLEWCTQSENEIHAVNQGRTDSYKCIVDGIEYKTMKEASLKIFNKSWLIKELRYKFGNDFKYKNHYIKVVVNHV